MSLKTRCPACDTVFKIVPDQLKVSKGWVRCGRCAEVFDAAAHAASADDINHWPETSVPAPAAPKAAVATATATATATSVSILSTKNAQNTPDLGAAQAINTPASGTSPQKKETAEDTPAAADLSFVRAAKNKAFWQRAAVKRTLATGCLGLAGLLFMQVVYDQRSHLAASNPSLKSSLDTFCKTLGCTIEAHKNIDAFKIDNSSFQKASAASADLSRAESFSFKISLKNNADMPLAMPAVELTLTEAGDKPVLRRVLQPKELGFNGMTVPAHGDWATETTISVSTNTAKPPISGYRVLLFYP